MNKNVEQEILHTYLHIHLCSTPCTALSHKILSKNHFLSCQCGLYIPMMIKDPLISTGRFKYEKGGTISLEQLTPFEETFFRPKLVDRIFAPNFVRPC